MYYNAIALSSLENEKNTERIMTYSFKLSSGIPWKDQGCVFDVLIIAR